MKKRGRGVAAFCYPIGFTSYPNPAAAFVKMYPDGSAVVYTGATDVGQGATTVLAQIAAETLGIPVEQVAMVTGDTERTPLEVGTVASRVTYIAGNAILRAATEARRLLRDAAADLLEIAPEDLELREGAFAVRGSPERRVTVAEAARRSEIGLGRPVIGSGSYNPDSTMLDPKTGQGKPYETYVFGSQVAEVEVDTETGEVQVLRVVAAYDCGTVVNPALAEGQVMGGIHMGLGFALTEEMVFTDGRVYNDSFRDYILPTSVEMPPVDLQFLNEPDPLGPYGALGIGEPALLPTAPAIINAIADATGAQIDSLPATPERVWRALHGGPAPDPEPFPDQHLRAWLAERKGMKE